MVNRRSFLGKLITGATGATVGGSPVNDKVNGTTIDIIIKAWREIPLIVDWSRLRDLSLPEAIEANQRRNEKISQVRGLLEDKSQLDDLYKMGHNHGWEAKFPEDSDEDIERRWRNIHNPDIQEPYRSQGQTLKDLQREVRKHGKIGKHISRWLTHQYQLLSISNQENQALKNLKNAKRQMKLAEQKLLQAAKNRARLKEIGASKEDLEIIQPVMDYVLNPPTSWHEKTKASQSVYRFIKVLRQMRGV